MINFFFLHSYKDAGKLSSFWAAIRASKRNRPCSRYASLEFQRKMMDLR